MNSLLEPAGDSPEGARPETRPVARIFQFDDGTQRGLQMCEAWTAFCSEMNDAVRSVFQSGRSPPEIAYAMGEIVHNFFRTRGLTLTSYELRRLVAELLVIDRQDSAKARPRSVPAAEEKEERRTEVGLVSFSGEPAEPKPADLADDQSPPPPSVSEAAFAPPPSNLVKLIGREAASLDRLLLKVVQAANPQLAAPSGVRIDRHRALETIHRTIDDILSAEEVALSASAREQLALVALSEICGLGLIDRLWADRSVRAIFVDGPEAVYVERESGLRERASEAFRNQAHLLDLASRLAGPSRDGPVPTGVVEFQLRDGGSGTVIFPPASPAGPVLVVRRGDPGAATLERLIASELIDRRVAGLLRVAARVRLNVLVEGREGSGKTALLAAVARDQGAQRIVTVARHRQFRWPSITKIELVASPGRGDSGYGALLAAASRLRPDLLVLDSLGFEDMPALAEHFANGGRGTIAALETPSVAVASLAHAVDLVVRLGRAADGLYRAMSVEDKAGAHIFTYESGGLQRHTTAMPAFADVVRAAGHGEALDRLLR